MEIVVAYFNNDSFENLLQKINADKITIYDKTGSYASSIYKNIVKLENKGGEGGTYLTHIIDNYENLSEYTLFMMDDMHNHVNSFDEFAKHTDTYSNTNIDFYQYNTVWRTQVPIQIDHIINGYNANFDEVELYKERKVKISRFMYDKGIISPSDYQYLEYYRKNKPDKFAIRYTCKTFGIYLPESYYSPQCASFLVTRLAVLRRPKDFYINLRTWLLQKPSNCFILELIWVLIFTNKEQLEYQGRMFSEGDIHL